MKSSSIAVATGEIVAEASALSKRFVRNDGTEIFAVNNVALEVRRGEIVVLLGPSGCGKTTLLRLIAGLEVPSSGSIRLNGQLAYSTERGVELPPNKRGLSMVFQSYALWPHMTAFDNVAYPLRCRGTDKEGIRGKVEHVLKLVGIPDLARQYPGAMSGGQQQRVALARAIVSGDELILFDEPLSNVDAKVREQLRFELLDMHRKLHFAALYVTHDQMEAMELADRIVLMRGGKIEQVATPEEIYRKPASHYAASFIGSINEIPVAGPVKRDGASVRAPTPLGDIVCRYHRSEGAGDPVVAFRPEKAGIHAKEPRTAYRWKGTVERSAFYGTYTEYLVTVGALTLRARGPVSDGIASGQAVWLGVERDDMMLFLK